MEPHSKQLLVIPFYTAMSNISVNEISAPCRVTLGIICPSVPNPHSVPNKCLSNSVLHYHCHLNQPLFHKKCQLGVSSESIYCHELNFPLNSLPLRGFLKNRTVLRLKDKPGTCQIDPIVSFKTLL